ncbi:MAG TPA: class I SAM-dependent methyltransferase [Acetobacteraceae bacterium]|nr:class I SAM-dependent methyltransferase [Acetobacteraceae bacterium]
MPHNPHETLVDAQFGSRASVYLTSAVHAQGADLEALAALVHGQPDARVLDLGCGAGHVSFAVSPHVRSVVACDLAPEMLTVVAQAASARGCDNLTTKQGVAEHLPFADGEFDCVLSRYSAHHWRDLEAGLREAGRVLKPGGIAGIVDSVSVGPALLDTYLQAVELLRDPSHVRSRTRAEWDDAIVRAGLVPGVVRPFRVRLEFAVWIERMRTPPVRAEAIRALQTLMSDSVMRHFAIEADGSFCIDVALFEAMKPAA